MNIDDWVDDWIDNPLNQKSPEKAITEMLRLKLISSYEADLYLTNYYYFQYNKPEIQSFYYGYWVASVNEEIFASKYLDFLYLEIGNIENNQTAYIEFIEKR